MDDDPLKQGAVINGLKVLGSSEALPTLVPALGIDQVIITIADAPQASLRRILSICEGIPVRAQMIPAMYDLLQGKVSITRAAGGAGRGVADAFRTFACYVLAVSGAGRRRWWLEGQLGGLTPPAALF